MESLLFDLDGRKDLVEKIKDRCFISRLVIDISNANTQVFSDGEVCVNFDVSMRGKRVYLLSSPNTSDKIMQLNMAIDACKRAAAKEIIPIIPYFPYARQDKKDQARGSIGAKVIAEMIENRGATSLITLDLHADQIQGFFNIPVLHMEGKYIFDEYIMNFSKDKKNNDVVLCAPDAGAAKRVKGFRDRLRDKYDLDLPIVMIDKTRKIANEVDEMVVIGEVKDKHVIIIDDMCDTGGTLCKASDELIELGALSVEAIVTHGIFSGPAYERFGSCKINRVVCSDSLPLRKGNHFNDMDAIGYSKIDIISAERQIMNAIIAINENISVEDLKKKR